MCDRVGFIEEMFIIPLNYLAFVGRMHFSERNDKCEWMPHYNRHNPFTTLNVKPVVSHFYHVFLHASIFLLGEILKVEIFKYDVLSESYDNFMFVIFQALVF